MAKECDSLILTLCIIANVDPLPSNLKRHLIGGGTVDADAEGGLHLRLPPTSKGYADAQVDDYHGLGRSAFPWSPPMRLSLRARASEQAPRGTLGFGFWNDPFGLSLGGAGGMRRFPAAPQAVWFFYGSEENEFSFVRNGLGSGWKVTVLRSPRLPAPLLVPAGAGAFLLGMIPGVRRLPISVIHRSVSAAEAPLKADLASWHDYDLWWESDGVRFAVDGQVVLESPIAPAAPLGFVAWIDNQYAMLSPQRGIGFGVLPTDREVSLELRDLVLERG
jgi:hypothetical protein